MKTSIEGFEVGDEISHVELAAVNYDQWILTVAVRIYGGSKEKVGGETVVGMSHVVFEEVEGFRVLDEGAMLMFPWNTLDTERAFVHRVPQGGWHTAEVNSGNMILQKSAKEYVIVLSDDCVSVIAYGDPKHVHS